MRALPLLVNKQGQRLFFIVFRRGTGPRLCEEAKKNSQQPPPKHNKMYLISTLWKSPALIHFHGGGIRGIKGGLLFY